MGAETLPPPVTETPTLEARDLELSGITETTSNALLNLKKEITDASKGTNQSEYAVVEKFVLENKEKIKKITRAEIAELKAAIIDSNAELEWRLKVEGEHLVFETPEDKAKKETVSPTPTESVAPPETQPRAPETPRAPEGRAEVDAEAEARAAIKEMIDWEWEIVQVSGWKNEFLQWILDGIRDFLVSFGLVDMAAKFEGYTEWIQQKTIVDQTIGALKTYTGSSLDFASDGKSKTELFNAINEQISLTKDVGNEGGKLNLAPNIIKFVFSGDGQALRSAERHSDSEHLRLIRWKLLTIQDNPGMLGDLSPQDRLLEIFTIEDDPALQGRYLSRYDADAKETNTFADDAPTTTPPTWPVTGWEAEPDSTPVVPRNMDDSDLEAKIDQWTRMAQEADQKIIDKKAEIEELKKLPEWEEKTKKLETANTELQKATKERDEIIARFKTEIEEMKKALQGLIVLTNVKITAAQIQIGTYQDKLKVVPGDQEAKDGKEKAEKAIQSMKLYIQDASKNPPIWLQPALDAISELTLWDTALEAFQTYCSARGKLEAAMKPIAERTPEATPDTTKLETEKCADEIGKIKLLVTSHYEYFKTASTPEWKKYIIERAQYYKRKAGEQRTKAIDENKKIIAELEVTPEDTWILEKLRKSEAAMASIEESMKEIDRIIEGMTKPAEAAETGTLEPLDPKSKNNLLYSNWKLYQINSTGKMYREMFWKEWLLNRRVRWWAGGQIDVSSVNAQPDSYKTITYRDAIGLMKWLEKEGKIKEGNIVTISEEDIKTKLHPVKVAPSPTPPTT